MEEGTCLRVALSHVGRDVTSRARHVARERLGQILNLFNVALFSSVFLFYSPQEGKVR